MRGIPWLGAALALAGASAVVFACGGATSSASPVGDDGGGVIEASTGAVHALSDGQRLRRELVRHRSRGRLLRAELQHERRLLGATRRAPRSRARRTARKWAPASPAAASAASPRPATEARRRRAARSSGRRRTPACPCPSGKTCSANGCRYEQYCNTTNNTCQPAPIGCGTPGPTYDGGTAPTGKRRARPAAPSRASTSPSSATRAPRTRTTRRLPDGDHHADLRRTCRRSSAARPSRSRRATTSSPTHGHAVVRAGRPLPGGARQVLGHVLPGDGQPRVHRRDGVELRSRATPTG